MRRVMLLILIVAVSYSVTAQEESPGRKGKFFLIPEFWLSFGTMTYVEVSPMVGYHVLDRLVVGLGPHYMYQSQKATPPYPYSYQTHSFGLKGFARFSLITDAEEFLPIKLFSEIFVHVEYEGLSLEKKYYVPPYTESGRFIYRGMFLGGGFSQRIGVYNSVSFTILWDINESTISPYTNPILRVGFNTYF